MNQKWSISPQRPNEQPPGLADKFEQDVLFSGWRCRRSKVMAAYIVSPSYTMDYANFMPNIFNYPFHLLVND